MGEDSEAPNQYPTIKLQTGRADAAPRGSKLMLVKRSRCFFQDLINLQICDSHLRVWFVPIQKATSETDSVIGVTIPNWVTTPKYHQQAGENGEPKGFSPARARPAQAEQATGT